ncbi:hypothetical protein ACFOGI_13585 [Virgibacillus xinjiangensis]|uniref:Uncharacterized protein n=1 Tax=Virgibacillus xinjiangensis TaxID=393090 RepID=A0ABV7CYN7_9BACI
MQIGEFGIRRRRRVSAGERLYQQKVAGIRGRDIISAGGGGYRRERGYIGRRWRVSAGERLYRQEAAGIGGREVISAGGGRYR